MGLSLGAPYIFQDLAKYICKIMKNVHLSTIKSSNFQDLQRCDADLEKVVPAHMDAYSQSYGHFTKSF